MNTQTIYQLSTNQPSGLSITGDHSKTSVQATLEVIELLGGTEAAFHEIKRLQNKFILPRMGSIARPLTLRDLEYARENEQRGERYWQWIQEQSSRVYDSTGYDYVYGYGHMTETGFVIVTRDGAIAYDVHN